MQDMAGLHQKFEELQDNTLTCSLRTYQNGEIAKRYVRFFDLAYILDGE